MLGHYELEYEPESGEKFHYLHMRGHTAKNVALCIMIHGYGRSRSLTGGQTPKQLNLGGRLLGESIDSFIVDLPGCGKSEGCFEKLTIDTAIKTIEECIRLARNMGYRDILLRGGSFGGLVALECMKRNQSLKGVVCWSTINEYEQVRTMQLGDEKMKQREREGMIDYNGFTIPFDFIVSARNHIGHFGIEKNAVPFLCIHGDVDDNAPLEGAQKIVEGSKVAQIVILEGEGHSFKGSTHMNQAIDETVNFFVKCKSS